MANDQSFLKTWKIESMDRVGYPDYFEYDLREIFLMCCLGGSSV